MEIERNESPDTLLEAENLGHAFDYTLYENVNLKIGRGESIAIVGRSGSGKSTLLHNLSGFLKPMEGRVVLFSQELYSISEKKMERLRRESIGIVFQMHYLFKGMSGRENIEIASILAKKPVDERILEALEIEDVIEHKIGELSGGQQQRVSIARVLSKKPKIIFADEPTGNLDKESSNLVLDVLLSYVKEVSGALFLVTHDEEMAGRCDRTMRLMDAALVEL